MPLREYQAADAAQSCEHCRTPYEQLEGLYAVPAKCCPHCGAPVKRLISAPRLGASGSGFDDQARGAGFHKFKKLGRGEYERKY